MSGSAARIEAMVRSNLRMSSQRTADASGQATYGAANLRQKTTGLPFIVFVAQKDDAQHAATVKVSPEPKARPDQMSSYAVLPFEWKAGPHLSGADEGLLKGWVGLNSDVLLGYWNGQIEYTEDAIEQPKKIG